VAGEILTFGGTIFGNSNILFSIPSGIDQSEIANLINSDSRLKDLVTASYSSGTLSITSKTKGTPGAFTVTSNVASAAGNSGIGTSGGNITAGVNVEGTINGEAATGLGTLLTGNSGNANTEGVQVRYSGTTTGNVGTVTFSQGLAARLENQMLLFSDSVKGIFKAQDDSLTSQIADIDRTIANREAVLKLREANLKARFQAMDSAISAFRAQQAQLGAALSGQR
jgi:flagellar hook-associated protein 2